MSLVQAYSQRTDVDSTSDPFGIRFSLGTRILGSEPTYFWSKRTERVLRSESNYLRSGCSQSCSFLETFFGLSNIVSITYIRSIFPLHGTASTWHNCTFTTFGTGNFVFLPCSQFSRLSYTLEHIEGMLFLFVGMWLFVTARPQSLFQKRLMAARWNTAQKIKRLWEKLQSSDNSTTVVTVVMLLCDQSVACSVFTSPFSIAGIR